MSYDRYIERQLDEYWGANDPSEDSSWEISKDKKTLTIWVEYGDTTCDYEVEAEDEELEEWTEEEAEIFYDENKCDYIQRTSERAIEERDDYEEPDRCDERD